MKPDLETVAADGTCEKTKRDGQRCRGMAMEGSRYCFFHNPATQKARKAAQQRGGRANRAVVLPADAAVVQLESSKDIAILLAQTINQARKGQIGPKVAGQILCEPGSVLCPRSELRALLDTAGRFPESSGRSRVPAPRARPAGKNSSSRVSTQADKGADVRVPSASHARPPGA
jgi:hypothetical protein